MIIRPYQGATEFLKAEFLWRKKRGTRFPYPLHYAAPRFPEGTGTQLRSDVQLKGDTHRLRSSRGGVAGAGGGAKSAGRIGARLAGGALAGSARSRARLGPATLMMVMMPLAGAFHALQFGEGLLSVADVSGLQRAANTL